MGQGVLGLNPRVVIAHENGKRLWVAVPQDGEDFDQVVAVHSANAERMGHEYMVGSLESYQTIGPDRMLVLHLGG
jgi:hypothetical protein